MALITCNDVKFIYSFTVWQRANTTVLLCIKAMWQVVALCTVLAIVKTTAVEVLLLLGFIML